MKIVNKIVTSLFMLMFVCFAFVSNKNGIQTNLNIESLINTAQAQTEVSVGKSTLKNGPRSGDGHWCTINGEKRWVYPIICDADGDKCTPWDC